MIEPDYVPDVSFYCGFIVIQKVELWIADLCSSPFEQKQADYPSAGLREKPRSVFELRKKTKDFSPRITVVLFRK